VTRMKTLVLIGLLAPLATVARDAAAQAPSLEIEAAMAFQTRYPVLLNDGCGHGFGIVPSTKLRYRANGVLVGEIGLAGQFEVETERPPICEAFPPPPDGDWIRRAYDTRRGNPSVVAEGRLVLTPIENDHGSFRTIGGLAWYLGRNTPAWLVGSGLRSRTAWGAVTVDVEFWNVGAPYDVIREHYTGGEVTAVDHLSRDREWDGHWQFRLGFVIWQSGPS